MLKRTLQMMSFATLFLSSVASYATCDLPEHPTINDVQKCCQQNLFHDAQYMCKAIEGSQLSSCIELHECFQQCDNNFNNATNPDVLPWCGGICHKQGPKNCQR
jgi:hypothetical protein